MKKFTSWIKETKNNEEKNVINENIGFDTPFASKSRIVSYERPVFNKFSDITNKLKQRHADDPSFGKSASSNRSQLLNMISLIPYESTQAFMKDWNYVKSHIVEIDPAADSTSDENSIKNQDSLGVKDFDNLNVDRK